MAFDPAPEFQSRRSAEEALYEVFLEGHRSTLGEAGETYDLLLSGGWDSRGMLGAAREIERAPRRTVSWGRRDDIPGSDPHIARFLANQYEYKHHFISYSSDSFVDNAPEWTRLTELSTDNFGWYGEGTTILLNDYTGGLDFVLTGDHNWGCSGFVRSQYEAMASIFMPTPSNGAVTDCLRADLRADAMTRYVAEVDKVLKSCPNDDPNDRRDFLYMHGRIHRYIFSLGYYKELAVQVRRPFLSIEALDLIERIPTRYRYNKNLYLSMMIRFFPDLFTVGQRTANSLPLWRRDLRTKPRLSSLFKDLLSENTLNDSAVGQFLEVPQVLRRVEAYYAESNAASGLRPRIVPRKGRLMQSLRQRLSAIDDIRLNTGMRKPYQQPLSDFDLLKRIALMTLYERYAWK